ncbi:MAG: phosphoribosylamine--glycine ligase [Saprospiraceae bacterium]|nr:phosphoribosylamine--glycine ligase [Saprospiraceae bacterium]MDP4999775.1 phosphoribosylamine--glycine ligase [Saprospiraceae bacterium]
MKILLLGNGGREHAIAWKISQSPLCSGLYILPGNAGTAALGQNVRLPLSDFAQIGAFVQENDIAMVVVGPEVPLVGGIYDYFRATAGLQDVMVIGPSKAGAALEGSKAFAKAFMDEFNIPTASWQRFDQSRLEEGLDFISRQTPPVVLKADGLAAGKGVLICQDIAEARKEFSAMLEGKFGDAGQTIVIEQFLSGREFSVFALTDGVDYCLLPVAKDYKRVGEGDSGLNTGGMGSVSPVSFVDDALMQKVESRIIRPTIEGIQKRGYDYKGFVFFGLIEVQGEPFVIEYNCRLGDPETQSVLPRVNNDLVELFVATWEGRLSEVVLDIDPQAAATVILVAGGYPEAYDKGKVMTFGETDPDILLFHAGTRSEGAQVLTDGGRVLAITARSPNFREALQKCYAQVDHIGFDKKYFRKDIGFDL